MFASGVFQTSIAELHILLLLSPFITRTTSIRLPCVAISIGGQGFHTWPIFLMTQTITEVLSRLLWLLLFPIVCIDIAAAIQQTAGCVLVVPVCEAVRRVQPARCATSGAIVSEEKDTCDLKESNSDDDSEIDT